MGTVWATVDRLIHDLGEVRSVVDEAEALPETAATPVVLELRGAMDRATDAITRIFTDSHDDVLEAAWSAIAHAQDAAREARASIAAARATREDLGSIVTHARAQAARAHEQRQKISEQAWRLRKGPRRSPESGTAPQPRQNGNGGPGKEPER